MFTRMSDVRQLRLENCTLCEALPDYLSDENRSATSQHSSQCPTNSSLERVELHQVKGLEYCNAITSCQCYLVMMLCGDVRVSTLKTCFPRVSELELGLTTVVCDNETEEELTSWLPTIQAVRQLNLAPQHVGKSLSLCHLLSILAKREELECLRFHRYTLSLDVKDTSDTVKQNNTLRTLGLEDCKLGGADLGQFLGVCSRQCPQLKQVWVEKNELVFDGGKVESVKQLSGLQELTLRESPVYTPAGQRLTDAKVKQLLGRMCPSAKIDLESDPGPDSDSDSYLDSDSDSGSESDESDSDCDDTLEDWRI